MIVTRASLDFMFLGGQDKQPEEVTLSSTGERHLSFISRHFVDQTVNRLRNLADDQHNLLELFEAAIYNWVYT